MAGGVKWREAAEIGAKVVASWGSRFLHLGRPQELDDLIEAADAQEIDNLKRLPNPIISISPHPDFLSL